MDFGDLFDNITKSWVQLMGQESDIWLNTTNVLNKGHITPYIFIEFQMNKKLNP